MVLAGFELTTSRSEDRRSSNWANRAAVEENFCNREKQNEDEHMSLAQTFFAMTWWWSQAWNLDITKGQGTASLHNRRLFGS